MKAGFYEHDLKDIGDFDGNVEDAARDFADEHHQIDEQSDMKFHVYIEDEYGDLHKVKMFTEYDPSFEVGSTELIK